MGGGCPEMFPKSWTYAGWAAFALTVANLPIDSELNLVPHGHGVPATHPKVGRERGPTPRLGRKWRELEGVNQPCSGLA